MKITKARITGGFALVAVAGAGAISAAPTAAQQYDGGPKPITIRAVQKGKSLVYTGPNKVERGAKLTVVNETNPKKVGPHTFSLVKRSLLPDTAKEQRDCGRKLEGVCGRIVKAHKVNLQTGAVNRPSVDVRKTGWDKQFGKKGDSFVTEQEDEKQTRKVKAKVGTRLTFFCAVHPEMQKKVRVIR